MSKPVYLDYNGTTPVASEVVQAMRPFLDQEFGNPSSSHWYGLGPKKAISSARLQIANLLNCSPEEIVFTSGGTESNNQAIKSLAEDFFSQGNHIITSQIEHPAVLQVCRFLDQHGFQTTYLPVDHSGLIRPRDLEKAIRPETILITIMLANNEVGTIQPIEEISYLAKANQIVFHTDAAQAIGKIPTDVQSLGVDLLTIAGHKVYAPKGIGALFIRKGLNLANFFHGAGQEAGLRPGTENVIGIVGLGKACQIAKRDLEKNIRQMQKTRDRLEKGLKSSLPEVVINGHPDKRLPNTLNLSFPGLEANRILEEIGLEVAASAGAACHSDKVIISHVLEAMDLPEELAKGSLRFTTGRMTTEQEIDTALAKIVSAVNKLRGKT